MKNLFIKIINSLLRRVDLILLDFPYLRGPLMGTFRYFEQTAEAPTRALAWNSCRKSFGNLSSRYVRLFRRFVEIIVREPLLTIVVPSTSIRGGNASPDVSLKSHQLELPAVGCLIMRSFPRRIKEK